MSNTLLAFPRAAASWIKQKLSFRIGRVWIGIRPTNESDRFILASKDSDPVTHFSQWHWAIYWKPWLSWKFLAQGSYCLDHTYPCKRRSIYPGGRKDSGHMAFYVCIPLLGSFSYSRQALMRLAEPKTHFTFTARGDYDTARTGVGIVNYYLNYTTGQWFIQSCESFSGSRSIPLTWYYSLLFRLQWISILDIAIDYEWKGKGQLIVWDHLQFKESRIKDFRPNDPRIKDLRPKDKP